MMSNNQNITCAVTGSCGKKDNCQNTGFRSVNGYALGSGDCCNDWDNWDNNIGCNQCSNGCGCNDCQCMTCGNNTGYNRNNDCNSCDVCENYSDYSNKDQCDDCENGNGGFRNISYAKGSARNNDCGCSDQCDDCDNESGYGHSRGHGKGNNRNNDCGCSDQCDDCDNESGYGRSRGHGKGNNRNNDCGCSDQCDDCDKGNSYGRSSGYSKGNNRRSKRSCQCESCDHPNTASSIGSDCPCEVAGCTPGCPLGMVFENEHKLRNAYECEQAIRSGTLFPELYMPMNGECADGCGAQLCEGQAEAFAAWEMRLYLNTHPCDENALRMFRKYRCQAQKPNYATTFAEDEKECGKWSWVQGPWPWEHNAACEDCK